MFAGKQIFGGFVAKEPNPIEMAQLRQCRRFSTRGFTLFAELVSRGERKCMTDPKRHTMGGKMGAITISRQTGSCGDEIATLLAERLHFELINDEKIHQLAEKCDDDYRDACSAYEYETFRGFFERLFYDRPAYKSLFEALNYELAGEGNVVLLGRGAQIVLHDCAGVFHARVVAPQKKRVERVAEQRKWTQQEAWSFLQNQDHQRRNLVQSIYKADINDYELYDIVCNTAHYSAEAVADLLVRAFNKKNEQPEDPGVSMKLKDLAFAKRLESAIRKQVSSSPFMEGIEVTSDPAGKITLKGFVQGEVDWEKAATIAQHHEGVTEVDNKIRIISQI